MEARFGPITASHGSSFGLKSFTKDPSSPCPPGGESGQSVLKGVGGMVASQIVPFADAEVMGLWAGVESAIYQG